MDTGTRDALVGSIYESGLNPAHWSATLAQLKDALGFRYAALAHQALPGERPLVDVTVGIEGDYLKRVAHYAPDYIARWGGAETVARLPLGEPAILSRVSPPARWQRTAWWREWAAPQGITDVMALGLARDRRQVGSIIFGQHVSQGPLTPATAQAARPLLNHLQRAVVIGRAVAPDPGGRPMLELALDCLDLPVLLLGPGLRLVHANRAAQGLLSAGGLRTDAHGRLRLPGLAPAEATAAVDRLFPGGWPLAALPAGWVAGRTGMLVRAGDGATLDIGLSSLSGAIHRGLDFYYLCYDNEAFGNTGFQMSAASPYGSRTATSPATPLQAAGTLQQKKDLFEIWRSHHPPYAATLSTADPVDLVDKVRRATRLRGPKLFTALAVCPPGWGSDPSRGFEIAKLALDTGVWPLKEAMDGKVRHTYIPQRRRPLEEYLRTQRRFAHLFSPQRQEDVLHRMQQAVDAYWDEVQRHEMPPR